MHTVTICADRDMSVAGRELHTMDAGLILRELVRAERRIELLDMTCIRVAGPTQLRDLFALDVTSKPGPMCFDCIDFSRVSPVACIATHALVTVHTSLGFFNGALQNSGL